MKEKIEFLLEKSQLRYIEINLKNGDSFSITKPNQSGSINTIAFVNNVLQWVQVHNDGCTYENFIDIGEIAFVTGLYGCPESINIDNDDLFEDDESNEDIENIEVDENVWFFKKW